MAISDKLQEVYDNVSLVYAAGLSNGRAEGAEEFKSYYYATTLNGLFNAQIFPAQYEAYIKVKTAPTNCSYLFSNARNLYKITLECDVMPSAPIDMTNAFYIASTNPSTLTSIDLTNFYRVFKVIDRCFMYQRELISILGALDISNSTTAQNTFTRCDKLEEVRFVENTISVDISFADSPNLTADSVSSIAYGLVVQNNTGIRTITFAQGVNTSGALSNDIRNYIINTKKWSVAFI